MPIKLLWLNTNCYFIDITFFIFISSKQQNNLSHLNISILIDENLMKRYRAVLDMHRINWDSFEFEIKVLDYSKVNMINFYFNIILNSGFNCVCFKYLKDERVGCGKSKLCLHWGLWLMCVVLMPDEDQKINCWL